MLRILARKATSLALPLCGALIGGCIREGTAPREPMTPLTVATPRASMMDCTLGESRCGTIDESITRLQTHSIGGCRAQGNLARMRFDAEGYGYRPGGNAPQEGMYTNMVPDAASTSGWSSGDPNVHVNDVVFEAGYAVAEISGFVAHEEVHQRGDDGPNHAMGSAYGIQDMCD